LAILPFTVNMLDHTCNMKTPEKKQIQNDFELLIKELDYSKPMLNNGFIASDRLERVRRLP